MNIPNPAGAKPTRPLHRPLNYMELGVAPLDAGDLAALDDALWTIFNLKTEPCRCSAPVAAAHDKALTVQLVWRGLLLGREFLQAAGIPVFSPGFISSITQQGNDRLLRVRFGVPAIDYIDADCFRIAYSEATKMVGQLIGVGADNVEIESLRHRANKEIIGALRRRTQSGKSTLPVLSAAHQLNLPFLHLGGGIYQLGWGSRSRKIDRSMVDTDSAVGSRFTQNKLLTAGALRMAGLPAPVHSMVGSAKAGIRVAHEIGWPVVVKPADSDRGEGVTVGIRSDQQLVAAFDLARKASPRKQVIVEQEVPGVCHRLFITNGQLLYAVKRWPKAVIGDGTHSVAQLIEMGNLAENSKPPWLRSEPFPADAQAVAAAAGAGFALDAIPPQGKLVPLRAIESTADGGVDEDVSHCIHPDNLHAAVRAARLFNLSVAGIDIITTDISRSWTETGAIINEVNFSPLLGGADISKSHVPEFLRRLIGNSGRIAVDVYLGGDDALIAATARQRELAAKGSRCYLASHAVTLDPSGMEIRFPSDGLYLRCQALLLDSQVERIILVVQNDQPFKEGLPVDRISSLLVGRGEEVKSAATNAPLTADALRRLVGFLNNLGRREQPGR